MPQSGDAKEIRVALLTHQRYTDVEVSMSEEEFKRIKDKIKEFSDAHTTPKSRLQSLRNAGIVDASGRLTTPYHSLATLTKSK